VTKSALVLACDDKFIPYTSVVARRIARHARDAFPIFVISDGVTDENKELARKFCSRIEFIEASSLFENRSVPLAHSFPRATYLRLFLDEMLDVDRIVYLDSDISVLEDVSPLLGVQPKVSPVAATYDIALTIDMSFRSRLQTTDGAAYFNAGVMVYDMKAIRSQGIFSAARAFFSEHPERCEFNDQDALNAVLDGRWQVLDWRWNAMNYMGERLPKAPFIRHFAGNKPWNVKKLGVERRFVDEWRADLKASPWPNSFQERTAKHIIREVTNPVTLGLENLAKSVVYSRSQGRRGNKARMWKNFPKVLAAIEQAALEGRLAERFPEKGLLA